MFLLVIKAIDKFFLIIMDAMDHINTNQFEIDKNKTKSHVPIVQILFERER